MRTASWLMLSLLVVVFTPFGITAVAIDPINTVNPATGEMSFPLSLGSMPVGAGRTTTVDLYYKAGIRTDEEASPAGMGFSYGGGGIIRKVVMVPDNNIGGSTSYHRDIYPGSTGQADCNFAVWYWAVALAAIVISIILTVLTWGGSTPLVVSIFGALLTVAGSALSMYSMAKFQFTPQDYIAGGEHDPSYISTPGAANEGRGYCNGATNDFPDIYFIATPYINGELIFCGPRVGNEWPMGLRAGTGMPGSNVQIRYNVSTEQFSVTLSDGMRLIFGGTPATIARGNSRSNIYSGSYSGTNNGQQCYVDNSTEQREAVAGGWLLGTIFYSDYVTTDTDNDPLTNTNLNQGGWIAYCYNKTTGLARRIPHSIDAGNKATAVFEPGVAGNYYFEDIYLDSIRTQTGKAQFNYVTGRLDDVWFAETAMNWSYFSRFDANNPSILAAIAGFVVGDPFAGTYNLIMSIINDNKENETAMIPPENQIVATSASIVPVARKILSAVVIKDIQGHTLQTSSLNTSYLLRPNSFYSMKKNTDGSWGYFSGNPQGACLTLTQIDVTDGMGLNSQRVQFSYANDATGNPPGFNPARLSNIDGNVCPKPLQRHITFKDIWGYYKPNTGDRDDYNTEGAQEKTMDASRVPYSAAWSLREIGLPTGMSVQWKYEAGRYRWANNIQIKTDGSAKYGGSPRVKEILVYDGVKSTPQRIAFFYTAMTTPGNFVENATSSNSSGHATVEPFPYLIVADGGTDSRLNAVRGGLYAPAKVAYQMTTMVQNYQPAGSATNTSAPFGYTTNEYITSKDFPNTGTYGETDNSWKRGYLKMLQVYNSTNQSINKKNWFYEFNEKAAIVGLTGIMDVFNDDSWFFQAQSNTMGIVKLKEISETKDGVTKKQRFAYAPECGPSNDNLTYSKAVIQNEKIKFGLAVLDCAYPPRYFERLGTPAYSSGAFSFGTSAWGDVLIAYGFSGTIKVGRYSCYGTEGNEHYNLQTLGSQSTRVIGVAALPGNKKVVVFHSTYYPYDGIRCIVFSNESDAQEYVLATLNDISNQDITSCAITDFNNNGLPDFVFISGDYDHTGATMYRKIYAVRDLYIPGGSTGGFYSSDSYQLNTDRITFIDFDGDGLKNDIAATGPTGGVNSNATEFSMAYTVLKNVSFSSGHISFNRVTQPNIFTIGTKDEPNTRYLGMDFSEGNPHYCFLNFQVDNACDKSQGVYIANLVISKSTSFSGDYNGTPNQIVEINSDKKILLNSTTPAFFKFADMATKHMLTQPCQNVTYYIPSGTALPIDPISWKRNVVSASATKWAQFDGRWLPSASYVWKADKTSAIAGAEPTTSIDFANFIHTPNASNPNWQLTGTIDKYSAASDVLQTTNALGISSTVVYSSANNLPIGSIANATFYESGVFTCDYDQNQNNYLDYSNGWEKYTIGIISPTVLVPHFGEQTLRIVNGAGTCRNFKVRSNITYEFSAWVKVGASQTATLNAELRTGATTVPHWPMAAGDISFVSLFPAVVQGPTTGWKLVKMTMTIPAGDQYYVRAYISGTDAYADDIRFAPKNAMVTSTYYDAKWRQPILSVDANNNPSQQITYDTWGRPIEWRKIDKSNPAVTQLVSKKEYHLMSQKPYLFTNMKFIMNSSSITISWDGGYSMPSVNVKYTVKAQPILGGAELFLGTITAPGSQKQVSLTIAPPTDLASGTYIWTVTAEAADGSDIVTAQNVMIFLR